MVHSSMADVPVGAAGSNEHIVTAVTQEVFVQQRGGGVRYLMHPEEGMYCLSVLAHFSAPLLPYAL